MKKGTDTERREGQQQQTKQGQGVGGRKRVQKQHVKKKKELLELSFDFLFPDSPYGLFCCESFHGGEKNQSINNLGIKKSAGCLLQLGSLSKRL